MLSRRETLYKMSLDELMKLLEKNLVNAIGSRCKRDGAFVSAALSRNSGRPPETTMQAARADLAELMSLPDVRTARAAFDRTASEEDIQTLPIMMTTVLTLSATIARTVIEAEALKTIERSERSAGSQARIIVALVAIGAAVFLAFRYW
jgi:hypothetical protein